MPLYDNNKEIENVFVGDREIQQIMVGDKEIWSNNKVIYLGYGTDFDVKTIYNNWANLTLDNFFFINQGSHCVAYGGGGYTAVFIQTSYTNGVYHHVALADNRVGNMNYIAICTKPDKLQYLADGSFDMKTLYPDTWDQFTIYNFLAKNSLPAGTYALTYADDDDDYTSDAQVQMSYTNGVITANYYLHGFRDGHGGSPDSHTYDTRGLPIYFYKGRIENL